MSVNSLEEENFEEIIPRNPKKKTMRRIEPGKAWEVDAGEENPPKKRRNGVTPSASQISHYLLQLQKEEKNPFEPLDQWKLQKLLYYVQGFHFAIYGREAFPEPILRYDFGPLVRTVWNEFTHFKRDPIDVSMAQPLPADVVESTQHLIIIVWKMNLQKSGRDLMRQTHNESPWKVADYEITSDFLIEEFQRHDQLIKLLHASQNNYGRTLEPILDVLRKEIRSYHLSELRLEEIFTLFQSALQKLKDDEERANVFFPLNELEGDDSPDYLNVLPRIRWGFVGAAMFNHPRALWHLSEMFFAMTAGLEIDEEEPSKQGKCDKELFQRWTQYANRFKELAKKHCGNDLVLSVLLAEGREKQEQILRQSEDRIKTEEELILCVQILGSELVHHKYERLLSDNPRVRLELLRRSQILPSEKFQQALQIAKETNLGFAYFEAAKYLQITDPSNSSILEYFEKAEKHGHHQSACEIIRIFYRKGKQEAEDVATKMWNENGDPNGFSTLAELEDDETYLERGRISMEMERVRCNDMLDYYEYNMGTPMEVSHQ